MDVELVNEKGNEKVSRLMIIIKGGKVLIGIIKHILKSDLETKIMLNVFISISLTIFNQNVMQIWVKKEVQNST